MLSSLFLTSFSLSQAALHPQFGPGRLIGHEALLESGYVGARILDPATERWAVGIVRGVGEIRPREMALNGPRDAYPTFDVDLDVLDGWSVPKGRLRVFLWEGSASRRAVIGRMIGRTALVRLAPVRDGRFLLVGSDVTPAFEVGSGEPFVATLLPYPGTRLETGAPAYRTWATLWRAGLALDQSAYGEFGWYMDATELPLTPPVSRDDRRDSNGRFLGDESPGKEDAAWLFRISKEGPPAFQMLAAEYLRRDRIEGALKTKRDLVLRSLREPDAFPDGLFRVASHTDLCKGYDTAWLPVSRVVDTVAATRSQMLASDLLELLIYERLLPENRVKLLPLLTSADPIVRDQTRRAFEKWQGTPPKDADPVAWHTARARLSQKDLEAAKAGTGT